MNDMVKSFVLDKKFLADNPDYYLYYPYLFSSAFDVPDDTDLLSIAGFLYYKSIIFFDEILDQGRFDSNKFFLANICQEEAVKILASMFDLSSPFWKSWNKRRQEYLQALAIDKGKGEVQSFEDFEQLADFKAAFGKVAIDALHERSVTKNEPLYHALLQSHKYYYSAFQLLDDLTDFKEDSKIRQFNMAAYELKQELTRRGVDYNNHTIDDLNKYLYLYGVGERLIDKSVEYLAKAEETVSGFPLDKWKTEIRKLNNTAVTRKLNIQAYTRHLKARLRLSGNVNQKKNELRTVLELGVQFIAGSQNVDGSWHECYNDAGHSDSWATAFMLSFLCQSAVKEHLPASVPDKALAFLEASATNQMWGYNNSWIPDADSTTFVLITQQLKNNRPDALALEKWKSFQNADGGYATYNDAADLISSLNNSHITNVSGWMASHVCVSSAALYLMSMAGLHSAEYNKLKSYLLHSQGLDGLWSSYWWTSPIYATSFVIKSSLAPDISGLREAAGYGTHAMMALQHESGCFGDDYNPESAFYTALVVDAICENENLFQQWKPAIAKAASWLQSHQMEDGSWKETPAMRMPSPDVMNPKDVEQWKENTRGVNIRVSEFNRLFSTSVTVAALAKYDRVSN